MLEARQKRVAVSVATRDDFQVFYNLLMPGDLRTDEITLHNVDALLILSHYYEVHFVKLACEDFLLQGHVTTERLLQAHKYDLKRQYLRCVKELAKPAKPMTRNEMENISKASPDMLVDLAFEMRVQLNNEY